MKDKQVKDLMIPLSDYATVSKDATLYEAIMALKEAQTEHAASRYPHRAVLVYDDDKHIIGKISQIDIIRCLEPKYDEMICSKRTKGLGLTRAFQKNMLDQLRLWDAPLERICQKAVSKKVEAIMYKPDDGEYVEADASLNEAIHQLVIGNHQSLLVVEKKKIVGILKLTDVFAAITDLISECKI